MTAASKKPVTDVWAFDFDGVVCDSVGESAISAWEVRKGRRGLAFFVFFFRNLSHDPHKMKKNK